MTESIDKIMVTIPGHKTEKFMNAGAFINLSFCSDKRNGLLLKPNNRRELIMNERDKVSFETSFNSFEIINKTSFTLRASIIVGFGDYDEYRRAEAEMTAFPLPSEPSSVSGANRNFYCGDTTYRTEKIIDKNDNTEGYYFNNATLINSPGTISRIMTMRHAPMFISDPIASTILVNRVQEMANLPDQTARFERPVFIAAHQDVYFFSSSLRFRDPAKRYTEAHISYRPHSI